MHLYTGVYPVKGKWKIQELQPLVYGLWVAVLLWSVPLHLFAGQSDSSGIHKAEVTGQQQNRAAKSEKTMVQETEKKLIQEKEKLTQEGISEQIGEENAEASVQGREKTENGTVQDASSGETEEEVSPRVALTFDDGPSAQYTPTLLDGLDKRGIHASFFVIGENIEKQGNAKILARMKEDGHVIGNHTYTHVNLSKLSEEQAMAELNKTDALIQQATGQIPVFARAPYGAEPLAKEKDLERIYVRWTVDPLDWMTEDAGQIVEAVVREVQDGDVILLHDCYESSVRAALQIVDILTERGYEFFTLEEMILE